ncbi:hypothetical protein [Streptomyces sp. KMM 9044]|uniref:hypothetical protein n=1 Tax=Streptomyces sp. KMM 9044 TaxID=2744474 RepID=UPI002151C486|nr:hypothetical protein [Streptomyces sp. KMM 9044]WAX82170.1 hypothetical protein HUV60_013870 [Streptomyces sp. KMM 9044]
MFLADGDYDGVVWAVNAKTGPRTWLCEDPGDGHVPQTFLKAGATPYGASGPLGGGAFALDAASGKARRVYDDNRDHGETRQVGLPGNRLLSTHGPEVRALPAV